MSFSESVDDKIRILHPDLREDAIHYIDARVKPMASLKGQIFQGSRPNFQ